MLGKDSKKNIWERHFLDSAQLYTFARVIKGNIFDFGSGAGFPGVVTAISNPQMEITLLDSSLKKVSFLNHVKAELQLKNIKVVHNRIEDFDLSKEDWIVSRAFSSPEELINKIKEKAPRDLVLSLIHI